MKTEDFILYGIVGIGLYFLYSKFKDNIGDPTAQFLADIWLTLTLPPAMVLQGNIALPNGVLIPLNNADVRQAGNGKVYLNLGGTFYQLQPSDTEGNWPAVAVP